VLRNLNRESENRALYLHHKCTFSHLYYSGWKVLGLEFERFEVFMEVKIKFLFF